jgi:hypothetical protein
VNRLLFIISLICTIIFFSLPANQRGIGGIGVSIIMVVWLFLILPTLMISFVRGVFFSIKKNKSKTILIYCISFCFIIVFALFRTYKSNNELLKVKIERLEKNSE